jgi:hypothetical protein
MEEKHQESDLTFLAVIFLQAAASFPERLPSLVAAS